MEIPGCVELVENTVAMLLGTCSSHQPLTGLGRVVMEAMNRFIPFRNNR